MHDYSIDNHPKEKILFALAFIAIVSAPILNSTAQAILDSVGKNTGLNSITITVIPVFGLFGFLYCVINRDVLK